MILPFFDFETQTFPVNYSKKLPPLEPPKKQQLSTQTPHDTKTIISVTNIKNKTNEI